MSALVFLAIAFVISMVGCGVLYLRSRQPTSLESGIDAFKREMSALSPDEPPRQPAPRPRPQRPAPDQLPD